MKRGIVNAIVAHPKAVTLWKLRVYALVLKSALEEQDMDSAQIALKEVLDSARYGYATSIRIPAS